MLKRCFMLLGAAALVISAVAQEYSVRGVAVDSVGEGEPYATIRIYAGSDTTKVLKTDVTGDDGNFSLQLGTAGNYLLRISAVGKTDARRTFSVSAAQPVSDVGTIVLAGNENLLAGVTVTAMRPLVKNEIDRLSYDVQGDADSKSNTIMEMLRKVPLVTVDGQDNVLVKGSSNFKIYKNGHPDLAMSNNPKEVLKSIPAAMVKRIEVITEPGAKYDAEGVSAILNIVMVENSAVKGVTGTVRAGVDFPGWNPNASGYLNTQFGKFIASVNYGYHRQTRSASKSRSYSESYYKDTGNTLLSESESNSSVNVHYGNIEASYEPDTLNLLTLSFGGYSYNYNSIQDGYASLMEPGGTSLYSYRNHLPGYNGSYYSLDGRFDYQHRTHRKDELLTLSYMLSTSRQKSDYEQLYLDGVNMPVPYNTIIGDGLENFREHTFQFDWTRPFAKYHKFETGVKYIYRLNKSDNTYSYVSDDDVNPVHTKFNHLTQVAAAYASYTFTRGKWAARAGLRYEYSYLRGKYPDGSQPNFSRNLSDWVPSASVNFQISPANSLKWAFTTRIQRPGISYLNPAREESATSVSFGNPYLSSARIYSTSLTFMHIGRKFTFNVVPGVSFSSNGIGSIQYYEDGKEVRTYANEMTSRWVGVSGYFQWQIHAKTSLMFNGNIGRDYVKAPTLGLKNARWTNYFFSQLTQQLPWKLRLTAFGGKWGGDIDGVYGRSSSMWFYGFGLQRSFLKEDRLTVSINAQRPFSGRYTNFTNHTIQGDYTGFSTSSWTSRRVGITVSYRFGSLNASVKKTATTIDNNDLVGGSSKGGGNQGGQGTPGGN
ncbi:MAG: outer membrane beta-barrel protein [Muribaculaceae bacterium]|nr:outer membrane beta-barrel protein [Muribaculaceae bacterium]